MAEVVTVLNYTRGILSNFNSLTILVTNPFTFPILEWGHFVPPGTQFIEINCCIGYRLLAGTPPTTITFSVSENGSTSPIGRGQQSQNTIDERGLMNLKIIIDSPETGVHNFYRLNPEVETLGATYDIIGPVTVDTISYGIPT